MSSNMNTTMPGVEVTYVSDVYEMRPSPGDINGRCMGCGQQMATGGHMCMVPVSNHKKRRFLVTIEEVEPVQGFQTTTHPGYEIVWTTPWVGANC